MTTQVQWTMKLAVTEEFKAILGFEILMTEAAQKLADTSQNNNPKDDEDQDNDKNGNNNGTEDGKYFVSVLSEVA